MGKLSSGQKLTAVIIAILALLAAGYFLFRDEIALRTTSKEVATVKVVRSVNLSYPDGWQEERLTNADVIAGILLKLGREGPGATLILRTIVGKLEEGVDINSLSDQIVAAFEKEIENFSLVEKKVSRLESFNSVDVIYKQSSAEDNKIYKNRIIIMPTKNQTFYLTFRSEDTDFEKIEADIEKMTSDFAAYLESLKL